jgi:hypothetical protein
LLSYHHVPYPLANAHTSFSYITRFYSSRKAKNYPMNSSSEGINILTSPSFGHLFSSSSASASISCNSASTSSGEVLTVARCCGPQKAMLCSHADNHCSRICSVYLKNPKEWAFLHEVQTFKFIIIYLFLLCLILLSFITCHT